MTTVTLLATAHPQIIAAYQAVAAENPVTYVAYNQGQVTYGLVGGDTVQGEILKSLVVQEALAVAGTDPVVYLAPEVDVNEFVQHMTAWHSQITARLRSIALIPADEAVEIQNNDTGDVRLIKDADKELFVSGVLAALALFSDFPIEELDSSATEQETN